MGSARSLARHYVRRRFRVLFAVLFLAIAGHGLLGLVLPVAHLMEWLLAISLVAAVFSVRIPWLRWLIGGLVVSAAAARMQQGLLHPLTSEALVALACLLAAGVALYRALEPGPVDAERVFAALDAYLLLGIAFGAVYWIMHHELPGSFAFAFGEDTLTPARAIYFSIVVQSTLGFGDIVPIGEPAQGVVMAQGMGGQIYLVVLVARLVSLYAAQENPSAPSSDS
jgi:hypothetical protein